MKPMEDKNIEESLSKLSVGIGRGSHVSLSTGSDPQITKSFERFLKSSNDPLPDIDRSFDRCLSSFKNA